MVARSQVVLGNLEVFVCAPAQLKDVDLKAVKAQRWEERIGAPAIWRGSPTGGLYTKENYQQKQRYQLVRMRSLDCGGR